MPAALEAKPLQDVNSITLLGNLIAQKYPVVRTWNVGSPAEVDLDSLVTYQGPYSGLANLGLARELEPGWFGPAIQLTVAAEVVNLFDNTIHDIEEHPLPGRSWQLSIRMSY